MNLDSVNPIRDLGLLKNTIADAIHVTKTKKYFGCGSWDDDHFTVHVFLDSPIKYSTIEFTEEEARRGCVRDYVDRIKKEPNVMVVVCKHSHSCSADCGVQTYWCLIKWPFDEVESPEETIAREKIESGEEDPDRYEQIVAELKNDDGAIALLRRWFDAHQTGGDTMYLFCETASFLQNLSCGCVCCRNKEKNKKWADDGFPFCPRCGRDTRLEKK